MSDRNILELLGFIVFLIAVLSPIIKLNTSITKLNVTLESFQSQTEDNHKKLELRVTSHGTQIDDITKMVIRNDERIKALEDEK